MSHQFFEGKIYHKRYTPVVHTFTYPLFFLDIDLDHFSSLKNRLFSLGGLNLFAFKSKDHFGQNDDFMQNVQELLSKFGLEMSKNMRFITLPRVVNFVFNPISLLIIFDNKIPTHILVEVHNYNGGRVVYPVKLEAKNANSYEGKADKTMYVSPFFETSGEYHFILRYEDDNLMLKIDLVDESGKKLTAAFSGKSTPFTATNIAKLFLRHAFLTLLLVVRTLWQSLKLKLKGLYFYKPTPLDQIRRY